MIRKEDIQKHINQIKNKYGEGYFIGDINGMGCYFSYSHKNSTFDIIFSSNNLTAKDIKFLFERTGAKITVDNPLDGENIIFSPFKSYIKQNLMYSKNPNNPIYKVEEHQLEHVYKQSSQLKKSGLLQSFNQSLLDSTKNKIKNTPKRKLS